MTFHSARKPREKPERRDSPERDVTESLSNTCESAGKLERLFIHSNERFLTL